MKQRGRPRHPDVLTPREWEVLQLLREGRTNEEIATALAITERTAKYHVSEILGKLGVSGRQEAAAWRPEERRPWWATAVASLPLTALAKVAAIGAAAAAVGALGLLAWGVIATEGDGESESEIVPTGDALESLLTGCVDGGNPNADWLTAQSLTDLTTDSDVVAVAKVAGLSRETADVGSGLIAIRNRYELEVERYLKGRSGDSLTLTMSIAYTNAVGGGTVQCLDVRHPLVPLGRYVFFLREYTRGEFSGTAEPFRFQIEGGTVSPRSPVIAGGHTLDFDDFPPRTEGEFIQDVLDAVGN